MAGRVLPDEQPTLIGEGVTLRPWHDDDVPTLLDVGADLTGWFDLTPPQWQAEPLRAALALRRDLRADQRAAFAVMDDDDHLVGQVDLWLEGDGVGTLSWLVLPGHRGRGRAAVAVRALIGWALRDLGLARVQARIDLANLASLALARSVGLRPEGVARGAGVEAGVRHDVQLVGLLAADLVDDPADLRWAAIRAGLPSKGVAAGVLARNRRGEALVLQTSYKEHWEIPGGLVEANEGLVAAARREVAEEVGGALPVGDLLVVDACRAIGANLDMVCLLFDGGIHDDDLVARLTFTDGEIVAAHWANRELVARCGPRLAPRILAGLDALVSGRLPGPALMLHDGRPEPSPAARQ